MPPPALVVASGLLVAAGSIVLLHAFARFVLDGIGMPAPVAPSEYLVALSWPGEPAREILSPVTQDNVEIVRTWAERYWQAPTEQKADEILKGWEPDADYYPVRKFPDVQPRHGHAEIVNFMLTFVRDWEHVDYESKRIIPVGDDRVLVHGAFHAEGHETRLPLQGDIYHCVWLRNGRILRWEDHLTEAGALDALGVSRASLDTAEPDGDGS